MNSGKYANAPAMLEDLSSHTIRLLTEDLSIPPEKARLIAEDLVDIMRKNWGGLAFYFPKGAAVDSAEAARRIVEEFTGSNHSHLAKKYGLNVVRIYQILRASRSSKQTK